MKGETPMIKLELDVDEAEQLTSLLQKRIKWHEMIIGEPIHIDFVEEDTEITRLKKESDARRRQWITQYKSILEKLNQAKN